MRKLAAFLSCLLLSLPAFAQDTIPAAGESSMTRRLPAVGAHIGDYVLYDEAGNGVRTTEFKNRYSVLIFGCLT
ncbi:MAG: hypothetical protein VXZ82_20110 [Planctomycetota bacterium]|nr:hypothetical protein [Planctomycetota bacterium]